MATTLRKSSKTETSAQKRAARKAEQIAKSLHSFAIALNDLSVSPSKKDKPTPRNWWKLQAGRFKNDPTFAEFVAQVQVARRQGE